MYSMKRRLIHNQSLNDNDNVFFFLLTKHMLSAGLYIRTFKGKVNKIKATKIQNSTKVPRLKIIRSHQIHTLCVYK